MSASSASSASNLSLPYLTAPVVGTSSPMASMPASVPSSVPAAAAASFAQVEPMFIEPARLAAMEAELLTTTDPAKKLSLQQSIAQGRRWEEMAAQSKARDEQFRAQSSQASLSSASAASSADVSSFLPAVSPPVDTSAPTLTSFLTSSTPIVT